MRFLCTLTLITLAVSSCSQDIHLTECETHSDCPPAADGSMLFCTSKKLCVIGTPSERLCKDVFSISGGPAPPDSIAIGALVTSSGDDRLILDSFKLGIEQINAHRTSGPPLALHICDISATAADPLKSMQLLVTQRNVVAILGPTSSRDVFAIMPEVINNHVPIMSPSATSPKISEIKDGTQTVDRLFFRDAPSDTYQGPLLAQQLPHPFPSTERLALLYVDDEYGMALQQAIRAASLKQPDIILSYLEPTNSPDEAEIQRVAEAIRVSQPDYVIAITNLYSDTVVKALASLPMSTKIIMAEGGRSPNVLNLIKPDHDDPMNQHLRRISGTAPAADTKSTVYQDFANAFKIKWPRDSEPETSPYTAYAYDAVYTVALAIGAIENEVTPTQVSQMLSRMNSYETDQRRCHIEPDRKNVVEVGAMKYSIGVEKVRDQSGLAVDGASGSLCFTPHGDRVGARYERWTINTDQRSFDSELIE